MYYTFSDLRKKFTNATSGPKICNFMSDVITESYSLATYWHFTSHSVTSTDYVYKISPVWKYTNRWSHFEVWRSQGGGYEDYCLLWCDTEPSGRSLATLGTKLLPSSSWHNSHKSYFSIVKTKEEVLSDTTKSLALFGRFLTQILTVLIYDFCGFTQYLSYVRFLPYPVKFIIHDYSSYHCTQYSVR